MRAPVNVRQLDGAHLRSIDRPARSVGGKNSGLAALDHLLESQQPFARAARTGAAQRS